MRCSGRPPARWSAAADLSVRRTSVAQTETARAWHESHTRASFVRALSIRQPYAEWIMRGTKRVENRSMRTKAPLRIYVYAPLRPDTLDGVSLPRGVVVGTVEIFKCTGSAGRYKWHLGRPRRLARPRKPRRHPQPVWFIPFP
jgi:hypothetical protein